jgi:hypothetical protein
MRRDQCVWESALKADDMASIDMFISASTGMSSASLEKWCLTTRVSSDIWGARSPLAEGVWGSIDDDWELDISASPD